VSHTTRARAGAADRSVSSLHIFRIAPALANMGMRGVFSDDLSGVYVDAVATNGWRDRVQTMRAGGAATPTPECFVHTPVQDIVRVRRHVFRVARRNAKRLGRWLA
jgi:hypothetical protein